MPTTLIDSNVLIDVIGGDEDWEEWSSVTLAEHAAAGRIAINPIIYSEVSIGFERVEDCESALDPLKLIRLPIPWSAAFLAGKSLASYRRRGGVRHSPLPDFYIGAHAAVAGMPLLTRDATRYRTYFPKLALISPD